MVSTNIPTILERFNNNFMPVTESGCWIWIGSLCGKFGYGSISYKNKTIRSHRLSWQLHKGPIPKGMHVLHKCDVPSCVNPDHLYLGTPQDNMNDKVKRKRHKIGVIYWNTYCRNGHKRTEDNIRYLKNGKRTCKICMSERYEQNKRKGNFRVGGKYYAIKSRRIVND